MAPSLPFFMIQRRLRELKGWLDEYQDDLDTCTAFLMNAVEQGWVTGVEALAPHSNLMADDRWALRRAAELGHAALIPVLLGNDFGDRTPALELAVLNGHAETAEALIRRDLQLPGAYGAASLNVIRRLNSPEIAATVEPAAIERAWATLDQVAKAEHQEVLISWCAEKPGRFPLAEQRLAHHRAQVTAGAPEAALTLHTLLLDVLPARGAKDVSALRRTMPHVAVSQYSDLLTRLIEADWGDGLTAAWPWLDKVPLKNRVWEPLCEAAQKGKLHAVNALLPVCDARHHESMALWLATNHGYTEVVKALLPHSDPAAQESNALRTAADRGHEEIVRLLIPVSDPASHDSEAFVSAAQQGHLDVAKLLLPHCDPNAQEGEALLQALENRHEEMVVWLVPRVDPTLRQSQALASALWQDLPQAIQALMPVSNPAEVVAHCLAAEAAKDSPDLQTRMGSAAPAPFWARLDAACQMLDGPALLAWGAAIPPEKQAAMPRFSERFVAHQRALQAADAPLRPRRRLRT